LFIPQNLRCHPLRLIDDAKKEKIIINHVPRERQKVGGT